jgi:hypothetical protein
VDPQACTPSLSAMSTCQLWSRQMWCRWYSGCGVGAGCSPRDRRRTNSATASATATAASPNMVSQRPSRATSRPAPTRRAGLPPDEGGQQQHRHPHQPPHPAQAAALGLHQRQQQAEHPTTQQQRPHQIQVGTARPPSRGGRHQPAGRHQRDQADGQVDVEHTAPAVRAGKRGQDQATTHRTGRGGQPDRGPEDAERPAGARCRGTGPGSMAGRPGSTARRPCPG